MNTAMTLKILSISASETELLGEQLGQNLRGSEVIELKSDLGGGKTTFVRGLARGMGSSDHVASPSFTIERVYHSPKLTLHHFDFHRLDDPGVIKHELAENLRDKKHVTVVEWPQAISDALPEERLTIKIIQAGENSRKLTLHCPDKLPYLLKGLGHADSHN